MYLILCLSDLRETPILESLSKKVNDIPSSVNAPCSDAQKIHLDKCCSTLDSLVSKLKGQLELLSSSLSKSAIKLSSTHPLASHKRGPSDIPAPMSASHSNDRSNNIILFGLPESPLLETKSNIDNMSTHLIGRSVKVADAFRLGRRPDPALKSSARPRPVLIKLVNCWDKRLLLASCRKLKSYSVPYKLFIREDLPVEARQNRRSKDTLTPAVIASSDSKLSAATTTPTTSHDISVSVEKAPSATPHTTPSGSISDSTSAAAAVVESMTTS